MQNSIIEYLENNEGAKTIIEINDNIGLKSASELEKLQKEINKLVEDGIVHETKKNKYLLMKDCKSLLSGKLEITKSGYGFLIQDNNDIYISKDNLNGAINEDIVLVDTFKRNNKLEGKVIKVLKRKNTNIIGEILYVNNKPTLLIDDPKLNIEVVLENHFANLVDGHKVLVELVKEIESNKFIGLVTKIIGHKNDPDIDILSVAYKHDIELDFSEEAKEEVKKIPDHVLENDKKGRKDLTDEVIFTIDGDDTKDIDDAINIKKIDNYYELGVHIADVSYYVKPNMALYEDAYNKGTSSYLADKVLPMLPHELSNGICSLNPGVERLAISCSMKIDQSGNIVDYDIFPSIIKSKIQMTYNNVNKILIDNETPDEYLPYKQDLLLMNELSNILKEKKLKNGYIDFQLPEAKIIQDQNGKCVDIIKKEQKAGEKLIENFMIIANECIATHFYNLNLPFVYRVHGVPKEEKIDEFLTMLKILNINVKHKNIGNNSKSMQYLLKSLEDYKEFPILSNMLLRSMQKAIYSDNNIGHFGLGLKNYTHFTSPIRRFPDTLVHTLIREYLFNNNINNDIINYYERYLIDATAHSSLKEQDSIDAEREVVDMKMAEYMMDYIGKEFEGIITTVTNFGFFVQLSNLIEGLVHVSTLDGHYTYEEDKLALVNNNKMYQLGMKVKVKVVNANKQMRMIDFEVLDGDSK